MLVKPASSAQRMLSSWACCKPPVRVSPHLAMKSNRWSHRWNSPDAQYHLIEQCTKQVGWRHPDKQSVSQCGIHSAINHAQLQTTGETIPFFVPSRNVPQNISQYCVGSDDDWIDPQPYPNSSNPSAKPRSFTGTSSSSMVGRTWKAWFWPRTMAGRCCCTAIRVRGSTSRWWHENHHLSRFCLRLGLYQCHIGYESRVFQSEVPKNKTIGPVGTEISWQNLWWVPESLKSPKYWPIPHSPLHSTCSTSGTERSTY